MNSKTSYIIGICITLLAMIAIMIFYGYTASNRQLSPLEAFLFQVLILTSSIASSYCWSQISSMDAFDKNLVKQAKLACRRIISLYKGISHIAHIVASEEEESTKLKIVEHITIEQIATADAAVDDWQDIVPELDSFVSQVMNKESGNNV